MLTGQLQQSWGYLKQDKHCKKKHFFFLSVHALGLAVLLGKHQEQQLCRIISGLTLVIEWGDCSGSVRSTQHATWKKTWRGLHLDDSICKCFMIYEQKFWELLPNVPGILCPLKTYSFQIYWAFPNIQRMVSLLKVHVTESVSICTCPSVIIPGQWQNFKPPTSIPLFNHFSVSVNSLLV